MHHSLQAPGADSFLTWLKVPLPCCLPTGLSSAFLCCCELLDGSEHLSALSHHRSSGVKRGCLLTEFPSCRHLSHLSHLWLWNPVFENEPVCLAYCVDKPYWKHGVLELCLYSKSLHLPLLQSLFAVDISPFQKGKSRQKSFSSGEFSYLHFCAEGERWAGMWSRAETHSSDLGASWKWCTHGVPSLKVSCDQKL